MRVVELEGVIFGGGVAGLWLLDELRRRGVSALLVERDALGSGQTICAQGILHSGLKYTLQGMVTQAAREARRMPELWREALDGRGEVDLSGVGVRSEHCYLWRTNDLSSRLGMFGAHIGLKVTPRTVEGDERPEVFRGCPGPVARVAEPVIDTGELLRVLAERNRERIVRADEVEFETTSAGNVRSVRLRAGDQEIGIRCGKVILAAGGGNEALREACGLASRAMQRRPLQMVMVRGDLPECYGHCVDGAKTRVTITSARDCAGRVVWQLGGQVAELGVNCSAREAMAFAREELKAVLAGVNFENAEWGSYRIDRAEEKMRLGARPDSVSVLEEGNVLTVWPTKLVLAPMLAKKVGE
ncbi:MAG: FAD-dependent oxidoreductase, partial [Planctomycetaceae bacterium]|nr:FAD-dependent oxidoreductase [Planctomycetaceae bacterium]